MSYMPFPFSTGEIFDPNDECHSGSSYSSETKAAGAGNKKGGH